MSSLPALLVQRAHADSGRVALAFKERGVWQAFTWAGVERQVWHLASALTRHGFGSDSRLLVTGQGSARQVLAVLAALSLGGSVASASELARQPGSAAVDASDLSLTEANAAGASFQKRAHERCLLELDLSAHADAVALLNSWLEQGFELGIPEEPQSAPRDARELGVSVRIASRDSWDAWAETVRGRLSAPGSLRRRLVDWALRANSQGTSAPAWSRWLAAVLVIRPLRRALGLSRWQRAISLGGTPQLSTGLLLAGLGVRSAATPDSDQQTTAGAAFTLATPAVSAPAPVGELVRQSA